MNQRRWRVIHAHKHLGHCACKVARRIKAKQLARGIIAPLRPHTKQEVVQGGKADREVTAKRWAEEGRERQKAKGWLVPCAPPRLLIFRGHARLGRGRLWRASHRGNPWLSLRPGFDHLPAIQRPSFSSALAEGERGRRGSLACPPGVGGAWGRGWP